jgi:hypothetical protein
MRYHPSNEVAQRHAQEDWVSSSASHRHWLVTEARKVLRDRDSVPPRRAYAHEIISLFEREQIS